MSEEIINDDSQLARQTQEEEYNEHQADILKQEQINEDRIRTVELIAKGFKVLRLWECEIKSMDIEQFKERINNV